MNVSVTFDFSMQNILAKRSAPAHAPLCQFLLTRNIFFSFASFKFSPTNETQLEFDHKGFTIRGPLPLHLRNASSYERLAWFEATDSAHQHLEQSRACDWNNNFAFISFAISFTFSLSTINRRLPLCFFIVLFFVSDTLINRDLCAEKLSIRPVCTDLGWW